MKIAIIGSGIAGNTVAWKLSREHDVTIYEANDYVGGHTNTHDISLGGRDYTIDTGFIVFNYWTYPEFTKMLEEFNVPVQPTNMSFSVKHEVTGLEYNGNTINSLFAQRSNILRPSFIWMVREILRFNREAYPSLDDESSELPFGEYLARHNYSQEFIDHYIIPMGAAIWSTNPENMNLFPAKFFIRFFKNHGLLSVNDRPVWHVIEGGSREYLKRMTRGYHDSIRLNTPVRNIERYETHVDIFTDRDGRERYDAVFIACHSDQALDMIDRPSTAERDVLGAIPYQKNEAVLHIDESVLPVRKLAWAAWNYHITGSEEQPVALTYDMNILQGIDSEHTFCVTLNNDQIIDEEKVLKRVQYEHPLFTPESVDAQARHSEINGTLNTWYCGAYWRNGFHEDGMVSALDAVEHFEEVLHEKQNLRRAG